MKKVVVALVLLLLVISFFFACRLQRRQIENLSNRQEYSKNEKLQGCLTATPNKLANRRVDIAQCRASTNCDALFPATFSNTPAELRLMRTVYNDDAWIIVKKIWGEQRRGLHLTRLGDFAKEAERPKGGRFADYDQVQELITDSLLIQQRVFHIRMYFVVDCDKGIFLYNNGLLIYCEEQFDINDIKPANVITGSVKSGCQNEQFLQHRRLPKTLHEFYAHLERNGVSAAQMQQRLIDMFRKYAKLKSLCETQVKGKRCSRHKHIFGPDILIRSDLRPIILEVNQWPLLATSAKNKQIEWQNPMKRLMFHCFMHKHYPPELFHLLE
jgi:hypothetical protein